MKPVVSENADAIARANYTSVDAGNAYAGFAREGVMGGRMIVSDPKRGAMLTAEIGAPELNLG